jgi:hypothetical protein
MTSTLADYSIMAFALLNGGRTVGYISQFMRVYHDPHDAAAVSVPTWALLAASNLATVCYALTHSNDVLVAGVFALNAIGCLAIVAMTAFKRMPIASLWMRLRRRIDSLRPRGRYASPRARHRDDMIMRGLMS